MPGADDVTKMVSLPPGVPNVQTWGRTVMSFGKYMKSGLTYDQMYRSSDSQIMSYCQWCRARMSSSEGYLKDFACSDGPDQEW